MNVDQITGIKVISLNFQILRNGEGEKIRKDFHKCKETFYLLV